MDVLQYASEKNIPVVFFTGHDEDHYKEKAMTLGAAKYYVKGAVSYEDIINPKVSGLSVLHEIRQKSSVPILIGMDTAGAFGPTAGAGLEFGAETFHKGIK